MILYAKRIVKAVLGRDFFFPPKVIKGHLMERFGSDYGGWVLLPSLITGRSVIYSFGVGTDVTFDMALIKAFQVSIHAFDPTEQSKEYVVQNVRSPRFDFHPYGLAATDGTLRFARPTKKGYGSMSSIIDYGGQTFEMPVRRLKSIMQDLNHTELDVLKIDIEGSEYEVIEDMLSSSIRPRQLLVEFHHRMPGIGIKKTKDSLRLLKQAGYSLFYSSPRLEEFSFFHSSACP